MADDDSKSTLPVFKPSGSGLGRDLLGLEHMKIQAEGWWAGQFKLYLKKLAPILIVNGLRVYSSRITVGPGACSSGDVSEFLDLIGFDDNAKKKLCDANNSEGISYIYLQWVPQYSINDETFGLLYRQLISQLPDFDTIEILSTLTARHAGPYQTTKTTSISGLNLMPADGPDLNLNATNIKLLDIDGVDITTQADNDVLRAILSILYISGDKFLNKLSISLHSAIQYQQVVRGDGYQWPYVYETWAKVTTKETYGNMFSPNFDDEEHMYKPIGLYMTTCGYYDFECWSKPVLPNEDGGYDEGSLADIIAAEIWLYRENSDTHDISDNERGIFTTLKKSNGTTELYMIEESLENTSPRELQAIIANNAKLSIKKKSSGFFSGFISSLLGALNAFVSLISTIGYYMPIVRIQMQAIMWATNGGKSWHQSKDEYIAQSNMILIAVASTVMTALSIGKAGPAMKAFYSTMLAYNTYSTTQNLKEFRDSLEYNRAMQELDEEERKLIEEALDKETNLVEIGDEFEVEEEFMPLNEDLKDMEQPLFGEGSDIEVKLTEGK